MYSLTIIWKIKVIDYVILPGDFVHKPLGYDSVLACTENRQTTSADNSVIDVYLYTTKSQCNGKPSNISTLCLKKVYPFYFYDYSVKCLTILIIFGHIAAKKIAT